MASVTTPVSVEEYLHSTFEYDAEYVDGRIVQRPMPQKTHSNMQGCVYEALIPASRPLGYKIWLEQRIRTRQSPPHYRIPDLCVTHGVPEEEVFTAPPFLCVEILSPDDTVVDLRTKVQEYLDFGVKYVWVIDPKTATGEVHTLAGIERVNDGTFRAGPIEVHIALG